MSERGGPRRRPRLPGQYSNQMQAQLGKHGGRSRLGIKLSGHAAPAIGGSFRQPSSLHRLSKLCAIVGRLHRNVYSYCCGCAPIMIVMRSGSLAARTYGASLSGGKAFDSSIAIRSGSSGIKVLSEDGGSIFISSAARALAASAVRATALVLTQIWMPKTRRSLSAKVRPPCSSFHFAPSPPSASASAPHVLIVSSSAKIRGPDIYISARWPTKGDKTLTNSCLAPLISGQRGPCSLTWLDSAKRAASASLWKRAVFCFSVSRSIPNWAALLSAAPETPSRSWINSPFFVRRPVCTVPLLMSTPNSPATPIATRAAPSNSKQSLHPLGLWGERIVPRWYSSRAPRYSHRTNPTSSTTPITTSATKRYSQSSSEREVLSRSTS